MRLLGLFDLSRRQRVEEFWALKSVSLKIRQGESVGLIGRNGSGKSTLLKVVAGIHRPTSGELLVARGVRIGSMIELGIGFHPELTGKENVLLNASIHGLSRAESLDIYDRVVAYSGLQHFMDVPIKNYSSGMHMRLGFAIAATLDPDVLLLDEIFAVGDEDFQKQCVAHASSRSRRGARRSSSCRIRPTAMQAICRRACVLDRGRLLFDGNGRRRPHRVSPAHRRVAARGARARRCQRFRTHQHCRRTRIWPGIAWPVGGRWAEEGAWVFDFLRRQGLQPSHYVLDVGCGSLSAASRLLPYMEPYHYWGYEKSIELYIAGAQIELPRAGVRAELGHFMVNDDFDLSEARASRSMSRLPARSFAPDAEQHRPLHRRRDPNRSHPAAASTRRGRRIPDPLGFEPIVHAGRIDDLQRPGAVPLQLRDARRDGRGRRWTGGATSRTGRTRAANQSCSSPAGWPRRRKGNA